MSSLQKVVKPTTCSECNREITTKKDLDHARVCRWCNKVVCTDCKKVMKKKKTMKKIANKTWVHTACWKEFENQSKCQYPGCGDYTQGKMRSCILCGLSYCSKHKKDIMTKLKNKTWIHPDCNDERVKLREQLSRAPPNTKKCPNCSKKYDKDGTKCVMCDLGCCSSCGESWVKVGGLLLPRYMHGTCLKAYTKFKTTQASETTNSVTAGIMTSTPSLSHAMMTTGEQGHAAEEFESVQDKEMSLKMLDDDDDNENKVDSTPTDDDIGLGIGAPLMSSLANESMDNEHHIEHHRPSELNKPSTPVLQEVSAHVPDRVPSSIKSTTEHKATLIRRRSSSKSKEEGEQIRLERKKTEAKEVAAMKASLDQLELELEKAKKKKKRNSVAMLQALNKINMIEKRNQDHVHHDSVFARSEDLKVNIKKHHIASEMYDAVRPGLDERPERDNEDLDRRVAVVETKGSFEKSAEDKAARQYAKSETLYDMCCRRHNPFKPAS